MKVLNRGVKKSIDALFKLRVNENTLSPKEQIRISQHLFKREIDDDDDDDDDEDDDSCVIERGGHIIFTIGKKIYRILEQEVPDYGDSEMFLQKFKNGRFVNTGLADGFMYKDGRDATAFIHRCLTFKDKNAKHLMFSLETGFWMSNKKICKYSIENVTPILVGFMKELGEPKYDFGYYLYGSPTGYTRETGFNKKYCVYGCKLSDNDDIILLTKDGSQSAVHRPEEIAKAIYNIAGKFLRQFCKTEYTPALEKLQNDLDHIEIC